MKRLILSLVLLFASGTITQTFAQCGLDIYIANDQSGSVAATENTESRAFILKLARAHELGNAGNQNRIAIGEFSELYQSYSFAGAGANYTTGISDIIAYQNDARTVSGGTDVYQALLQAFRAVNNTPVAGRNVKKVIFLITDASSGQVSGGIIDLALQIKYSGITIAVLAIAEASDITLLQGDNVASDPSLYFSAPSYTSLLSNVTGVVNDFLSNTCSAVVQEPSWDFTIDMNTANCGVGEVNYTVNNLNNVDFSGTLSVSFYNNDPTISGSTLLTSDVRTGESVPSGSSKTFTFTDNAFLNKARVYAVVNLSTSGNNAVAPLPFNLRSRIADTREQNPYNNISRVVYATGCATTSPQLEVSNTFLGISCDKKISYQVQVCNTGAVTALGVLPTVIPENSDFILRNVTSNLGVGVTVAKYANPGGDIQTEGYDGYQGTALFPCVSNDITSPCAFFKYQLPLGNSFISNAVFSFPRVSAGSGVPKGATIISAKLIATTKTGGYISGIKRPDVGIFNATNHPGDLWTNDSTNSSVPSSTREVDVTSIAQELVNQPGWTENSTMAFVWKGSKAIMNITAAATSFLEVTYLAPFSIAPGECGVFNYVFEDTTATPGTFNASVGVIASTVGTVFLPNTNFTTNGISGLNGYDGADLANTSDDVTIPADMGCSLTSQPITTSVVITPTTICAGPGNYVTATVTINNPNTEPLPAGLALHNLMQNLNLTGAGATFMGEPYNLTNGLQLVQPNVLDPTYPGVPNALSGKSAQQSISILLLPPGVNTFQIDLAAGNANFNLASVISQIPVTYNMGGVSNTASDATGVAISAAPTVLWTCPPAIAAGNTITIGATTTGASTLNLVSATSGDITNAGTVMAPAAIYAPTGVDISNGYASFSIYAQSSAGCEAAHSCQVPITGVAYDYGDAPASYDLGKNAVNVAAGSTLLSGLSLGVIAPGTEAIANASIIADGDGLEEDGLVSMVPVITGTTATYKISVTNTTTSVAYVSGYVDIDGDSNFLGATEQSATITIPAGSGTVQYDLVFSNIPVNPVSNSFMRLRLSTDQTAVELPFGASPQGEVEDYRISLSVLPIKISSFKISKQKCDVIVNWEVESAENFSRFVIERSNNGYDFKEAGVVNYLRKQKEYGFKDIHPGESHWYYRLKLIDIDGNLSYSTVAVVNGNCDNKVTVSVYPNPVKNVIYVNSSKPIRSIKLVTISGQVLKEYAPLQHKPEAFPISGLSTLSKGVYLLQVINSDGTVNQQKLIKE